MSEPKAGRGFVLLLLVALLPTVPLCWLLSVCILLSTVGCLSMSLWVGTRLMAVGRRDRDSAPDVVDEEDEDAVMTLSTSESALPPNLAGEAPRSAAWSSRSTSSMVFVMYVCACLLGVTVK